MRMIYIGIGLYALSVFLFATGHGGSGLLCIVAGSVLILHASEKAHRAPKSNPEPYAPQRAWTGEEMIDMDTGEILADWRTVLADATTHKAMTGCMVERSDFVNVAGLCPLGGTYEEH